MLKALRIEGQVQRLHRARIELERLRKVTRKFGLLPGLLYGLHKKLVEREDLLIIILMCILMTSLRQLLSTRVR